MFQRRLLFWLAALPLLAAQPLLAATVQVGTCKPKLPSFATISAAVSSVPAGSTIQVCPGTYAEQVVISQSLNLEGISVDNSDKATITVPSGGLVTNATSIFGESVVAQILVQNAAWVTITNLTVDGTGGDVGCSGNTWLAGIFYGSGSSGDIRRVTTTNQIDGICGVGIWAENGDGSHQSMLIRNSAIHNVDSAGIFVGTLPGSSLHVEICENVINPNTGEFGVVADTVSGELTNNDVSNALIGVFENSPDARISGNAIATTAFGIYFQSGGSANNNKISASDKGIVLEADGANLRNNRIITTTTAGIEFNCHAALAHDNFINDALVGFDMGPAAPGDNTFANTATIVANSCAPTGGNSHSMRANVRGFSQTSGDDSEWHMPSKPYGKRTH